MRRIPVESGNFVVSKTKDEILEAYLGTCVGVTLCDREAKAGGLIHLVLPEPADMQHPWRPEMYAATGLPILIQALCSAGAKKSRLEACLAGGGLVGPLSELDLRLDIGGRTSEVVERILSRENIAIGTSEIGGYFSCRLALDLRTFESSIEPIGVPVSPCRAGRIGKLDPAQIKKAIEGLKPIPQIALKLIRMLDDDSCDLGEVVREVRRDQVVSARVIGLCNSVYYGGKVKIDSIERALMILGNTRLLSLLLSTLMEDFLHQADEGYSLCKGGLFKHALGVAVISRRVALLTKKVKPDVAYTAGLLHDIGKVVLDQYLAESRPYFYRRTEIEGEELVLVETAEFGIPHTEAGSVLARAWSLPDRLDDAIRHHHNPEGALIDPELTNIVYLADLIMSRFKVGQEMERLNTRGLETRLRKAGLGLEQLPTVVEGILDAVPDGSRPDPSSSREPFDS